jgi:hypothetical protein
LVIRSGFGSVFSLKCRVWIRIRIKKYGSETLISKIGKIKKSDLLQYVRHIGTGVADLDPLFYLTPGSGIQDGEKYGAKIRDMK